MVSVFLVDDEIVVREGIRNSFPWDEGEFSLAGEAPDGEIALSMLQEIKPDILITDIKMPFMDGLALCRAVARTMPWTHIVILSGYDDFAYAKEAISLGVKEYLLKPVSAMDLLAVLRRIKRTIEEERAQQADVEALRRQIATSSRYLQEKLLSDLLDGAPDGDALAQARKLKMNLLARWYAVMLIDPASEGALLRVRGAAQRLAEGSGGAAHVCERMGRLALLVLGDTAADLEERAYAFAQAVKHEAEQGGDGVRVAIGASVEALTDLPHSSEAALAVLRSMEGQPRRILGISDVDLETPRDLMRLNVVPLYEKLEYASARDVDGILEAYFASLGGMAVQSALMANYVLVDATLAATRIVKQSGGDPAKVLPENVDGAMLTQRTHDDVLRAAKDMLTRALVYRDRNAQSRYSAIIRKACAYIEENYKTPEITLHDVAGHVALSNNHFCTVFSQEMGVTFIEYLTRLRMEKAKGYLKSTDLRSADIAGQVGYNDPNYFRYLFKKHMGMNPRDYRNSCRKG